MIYQLNYELKTIDHDYAPLYSYLEHEMGTSAMHVLRDSWWIAIQSEIDIDKVSETIRSYMGDKDIMYLCKISDSAINGWMPSTIWKWYNANK